MSSPIGKRTKLFLTADVHFAPFKSSINVYNTHANLIASVWALLGHHLTYEDSFFVYLTLAHALEYIVELVMIFVGMPRGYGRVKTLTDAKESAFQFSNMVGVLALWESIQTGIVAISQFGELFNPITKPFQRC